jgi:hypothetical protein
MIYGSAKVATNRFAYRASIGMAAFPQDGEEPECAQTATASPRDHIRASPRFAAFQLLPTWLTPEKSWQQRDRGPDQALADVSVHSSAPSDFRAPMARSRLSVVARSAAIVCSSCSTDRNPLFARGSVNIFRSVRFWRHCFTVAQAMRFLRVNWIILAKWSCAGRWHRLRQIKLF